MEEMFPAHAGMNRGVSIRELLSIYVPRTRGDEPPMAAALTPVLRKVNKSRSVVENFCGLLCATLVDNARFGRGLSVSRRPRSGQSLVGFGSTLRKRRTSSSKTFIGVGL